VSVTGLGFARSGNTQSACVVIAGNPAVADARLDAAARTAMHEQQSDCDIFKQSIVPKNGTRGKAQCCPTTVVPSVSGV
jgi:hypothetical protein